MNKTILKWAGSKVGIMDLLRPHLPKTKRLVEPFAGSCAVMMNTDYEQYL
ncbi:DNA adenine methylase, partial [Morganella morganii]